MSFLWYWPSGGWDFDKWKEKRQWQAPKTVQSGQADPVPLVDKQTKLSDWETQAKEWRAVSDTLLGKLADKPPAKPRYEWLGPEMVRGGKNPVVMMRVRYALTEKEWGYAWLLVPSKPLPSRAAVIALHQTQMNGKNEVVALDFVPEAIDGVYYAMEMAERGFVVLAPDAIAFGERAGEHRNAFYRSANQFFAAQPDGSVLGKMAYDTSRALDFLQTVPQVDPKKIGCVGHSHGGYGTIFAMLADDRIKAGVVSCGMSMLRADPSPDRWWRRTSLIPNLGFYEGMMQETPMDYHHWVALIAPRPLYIINALQDKIFPNTAALKPALELSRDVYSLYDARDKLQHYTFDGGHQFIGEGRNQAYDMLAKELQ